MLPTILASDLPLIVALAFALGSLFALIFGAGFWAGLRTVQPQRATSQCPKPQTVGELTGPYADAWDAALHKPVDLSTRIPTLED